MNARAVQFDAPKSVSIVTTSVDDPGPEEVTIEATVSAISPGSELLVYRGNVPANLQADPTLESLDGTLSYPLQYGYATVGTVSRTGPDVDSGLLGEEVFAFHPHQTAFTLPETDIVTLPDGIDSVRGVLFPTVETATNFLLDGEPKIGETVVVFGAGVVGLTTIHLLSEYPLEQLVAIEPIDRRRELARSLGADAAYSPDDSIELGATGADLVYELSGNPAALDDALELVGYDGRIVVGSWYGTKRHAPDFGGTFHRDRISIVASQVSTIAPALRGRWSRERRRRVACEQLSTLPIDALVTDRLPFTSAAEAYELLDTDPKTVQILLTYP